MAHYGRKGMKWYQHIFGEKNPNGYSRRETKRERTLTKYANRFKENAYKMDNAKTRRDYVFYLNKALRNSRKLQIRAIDTVRMKHGKEILDKILKDYGGYEYAKFLRRYRITNGRHSIDGYLPYYDPDED